jgi:hypothetical protein
LANNSECAKLLYNLAADRFDVVDPSDRDSPTEILISSLNIIDTTSNNPKEFNEPIFEGHPVSIGKDANDYGVSAKGSQNGDVRFFDTYFSDTTNDKGMVFFHEVIHVLLGGHREVATSLGLNYTPMAIPPNPNPPNPKTLNVKKAQESYELTQRKKNAQIDERNANNEMNKFIANGCVKK